MAAQGRNRAETCEMDPKIWSNLPIELLDHILTFLPLKSFLSLTSTCKRFHSLLSSPTFAFSRHPPSLPSDPSAFLVLSHPHSHRGHFPLYDSLLGSWRSSPLPSSSSDSAVLLSTSNSLFCFSLPSSSSFLVSNLLTRSSRLVPFPTLPFSNFDLLSFVSTPSSGYRILVLSSRSSAFLYDSRPLSWRRFDSFDLKLTGNNNHGEGVYFDDKFYFATSDRFPISRFDPDVGAVERCDLELPPDELTFCRLVTDGERRMFLVGGVGANGISRGMKVWTLGEANEGWIETERVPELICRKLTSVCYHNYEHVYCFWHQGMICICCYTWPEVLYYRESRRTWHWLPRCPSLPEKWSCGFRWYSFLPEISAHV